LLSISAGLLTINIAAFAYFAPFDEPISLLGASLKISSRWNLLGRHFLLDESNRAAAGILYLVGGFLFSAGWTSKKSAVFYLLGLGVIGLAVASIMIEPYIFSAILMELAAIFGFLILTRNQKAEVHGGFRLLSFYTLSMILILLAGWSIETGQREVYRIVPLESAIVVLALGFAILFYVPPFHAWVPMASEEVDPFAYTFVVVMLLGGGLFFLLRLFASIPEIREREQIFTLMRHAGAAMGILCAIWGLTQSKPNKAVAYAVLSDIGVMIIAISLNSIKGFELALGLWAARVISMSCWALGSALLMQGRGEEESILRAVNEFPMATAISLIGLLSLAGFPMTAGFPARYGLITEIAKVDLFAVFAILITMAGIIGIAIRIGKGILQRVDGSSKFRMGRLETIYLAGGLVITLAIGIFPQVMFPWLVRAVSNLGLP
jgi:formate hydrogenlyase subunit 3/multisubunit Na+/H+ antiporter MnhD subunit